MKSGRRSATHDYNLLLFYPQIALEWHPDKNDRGPETVTPRSKVQVWWRCTKGHEWQAPVKHRTDYRKCGCPYCSGKRASPEENLAILHPELTKEWHPSLNGDLLPSDVRPGSNKKVWWLCHLGHEWQAQPNTRTGKQASGCPFCKNKKVDAGNNLRVTEPIVASQWHPTLNGDLLPEHVTRGSDKRIWWQCSQGHNWETTVSERTRKKAQGCPSCATTHSGLEKKLEALLGLPKFNRCPLKNSTYRPDIKVSDSLYVNADGLYWHCVLQKSRTYHRDLRRAFEAEGMRILQFYEDEIHERPAIVKSIIDAISGRTSKSIGARQTSVVIVSESDAMTFLETNHLMGGVTKTRHLGLTMDSQLVYVMSYRVHKTHVEIVRSAGLLNTIIVGGFQKLVAAIRKKYPMLAIRTLVDLRYADGHSLEIAGFQRIKEYLQYQYTDGIQRRDKRAFRVPAGTDEERTAAEHRWYRIFDAGRAVYELQPRT